MFIPTQEERYAKKSLMTLLLCVIAPAAVYAYVISDKLAFPVDSLLGLLNILLFFTYPLAFVFSKVGIPFYLWGIVCSLLVHMAVFAWVYTSKRFSPKQVLAICITIGMLDLLVLKMINSVLPG